MGIKADDTEYADDMTLMEESPQRLFEFMKVFEEVFSSAGLKLNKKKTKIMAINCSVPTELKSFEIVTDFKLLGSIVSSDGTVKIELKNRRRNAWIAFNVLSKVWKETSINVTEKVIILNSLVMSIFLYGLEIVPLTVSQSREINAFQRRLIRCCLKLNRRAKITVQYLEASEIVGAKCLGYIGHLIRSEDTLYNELLFPSFRGLTMKRGRPIATLKDTISRYLVRTHDKNYKLQPNEIRNMALNREFWSETVADLQKIKEK